MTRCRDSRQLHPPDNCRKGVEVTFTSLSTPNAERSREMVREEPNRINRQRRRIEAELPD